ncbi:MAG: hypothetical protein RQ966_08925 [Acetobacteraceae bacterium]|nr:hypothetical protein [Acetobacteraceae bacterium]
MRVDCYTSASFAYLDRARVLAETIRAHHPKWRMHLLLCDEEPPGFDWDPAREDFHSVVRSSDLGIPEFRSWAFGHNIVEFCTAVKGFMLDRLLAEGTESVVYLDPDIALFAPLVDVERLLSDHAVVLTPHLTVAEEADAGIRDNEIGSLKHGVYNLGFVAVRNCEEGRKFGRWWRDRLHRYCWDDIPAGLFVDQRWCDLAPALFADVAVLRDPGYNVASWNLGSRPISIGTDGMIRAGDSLLRFFHFTKVSGVGEQMLRRYAYGRLEVFELLRYYRARLAVHRPARLPHGWWALNHFRDGTPIRHEQRIAWRHRVDLRQAFQDPFESGAGSYQEWFMHQ